MLLLTSFPGSPCERKTGMGSGVTLGPKVTLHLPIIRQRLPFFQCTNAQNSHCKSSVLEYRTVRKLKGCVSVRCQILGFRCVEEKWYFKGFHSRVLLSPDTTNQRHSMYTPYLGLIQTARVSHVTEYNSSYRNESNLYTSLLIQQSVFLVDCVIIELFY